MSEKVIIPRAGEIKLAKRLKPSAGLAAEEHVPFLAGSSLVPPMATAGEGYNVHVTGPDP